MVYFNTSLLFANDVIDEINHLLTGMYELETWVDGDVSYKYPDVAGTLSITNGQIGFTLDNRINKIKTVKVIAWGDYHFSDDTFHYQYSDWKVLIVSDGEERVNDTSPWEGYRTYDLKLEEGVLLLSANNGNQTWRLDEANLIYADREWGEDKRFAQRIWKRISK